MTREQDRQITELVESCSRQLHTLAYYITKNKATAEDMVQNAFTLLCQNTEILSRHTNPKGWLYRATYFFSLRETKRAHYKRNVPLEPEEIQGAPGVALPAELYLPKGLTPQEREIILMRLDECLDYKEIATRKGTSEAACRQSYSRAIRRCRQLYREEELAAAEQE